MLFEARVIENEGYRAQMQGKTMRDNPYDSQLPQHWLWRKGFIEAFKDSN